MWNKSIAKRGNLFARELEAVLAGRGIRLAALHEEMTIFPDKVRRLHQSLYTPHSFPILNEDEMERLVQTRHLSNEEILRLKAALLATSVEAMLIEYINPENALQAAEAITPLLFAALQEKDAEANDAGTKIKGDLFLGRDDTVDNDLEEACTSFDRAEMLLHLSSSATSQEERVEYARRALQLFEKALAQLESAEQGVRALQGWRDWYAEIQRGRDAARARLEEAGR